MSKTKDVIIDDQNRIKKGLRKTVKQEITCPRCKGKGHVFDIAECVFTAGIAFVLGVIDSNLKHTCPKCEGTGSVYQRTIIEEE